MAGRYRHLVRTEDGRTPENPCGMYCWMGDVADWAEAANKLEGLVLRAWAKLRRENPEQAAAIPVPEWREQVESDVPGWWDIYVDGTHRTPAEDRNVVDHIIGIMEKGADLLEEVQDALGADSVPVAEKTGTGTWWDSVVTGLITATVLAGGAGVAYYIVKKRREEPA